MNTKQTSKAKGKPKQSIAMSVIVFAIICFVTSFFMTTGSGDKISKNFLGNEIDKIIGPIQINDENTTYQIDYKGILSIRDSLHVTIEVLDQNKKVLYAFGKDMWRERGVDHEGYSWEEQDSEGDGKIVFKEPGTYFIKLSIENDLKKPYNPKMKVKVQKIRGSHLPHLISGIIALLIGILLYFKEMSKNDRLKTKSQMSNAGIFIAFVIFMIVCIFVEN